jgi:hypothetical protein
MTPKSIKPTGVPIARVHRRQHFDTRFHPPAHHSKVRSDFLTCTKEIAEQQQAPKNAINSMTKLQGCVKLPGNKGLQTSLGYSENGGRI